MHDDRSTKAYEGGQEAEGALSIEQMERLMSGEGKGSELYRKVLLKLLAKNHAGTAVRAMLEVDPDGVLSAVAASLGKTLDELKQDIGNDPKPM